MDPDPASPIVPAAGATFGRYELLFPLAHGGMASVWAGRAKGARGFEQLVAVKTMSSSLAEDPRYVAMFLDEARHAARVRHANVVSVLDLGEVGNLLYLVMEWVDGEPLSALCRDAAARGAMFPLAIVGRIVVDLCAGLDAAHALTGDDGASLGLVHRDVSPQNVMISRDGHVKLIDFGLAKATLVAGEQTEPGHTKGKLGYMAPEQAAGHDLDRRADLFALGVVLFQLLTGHHPFRANNTLATLQRLMSGVFPTPRGLRPLLPDSLDLVTVRAMSPEPGGRYSSAAELSLALSDALSGEIATSGELASFLRMLAGDRLAERQRAIRVALAGGVERVAPPSSVSGVLRLAALA